jgi:hypothetical protein
MVEGLREEAPIENPNPIVETTPVLDVDAAPSAAEAEAETNVSAEPCDEPCDETSNDEDDELDRLILAQLEKDDLDMDRIRAEAHLALEGRIGHTGGLKTYNADEISAARQAASNDVHYRGEKPKEVKQIKVNLGYGAKKRVKP